jgi:DNA-directed RNA polymerase subunit RPC12/RpoP
MTVTTTTRMTAACATCGGRIVYHPRHPDDPPPRTAAINDENRWAHTDPTDWMSHPHRAHPKTGPSRESTYLGHGTDHPK